MLSLVRPNADADFALEAQTLLGELQVAVANRQGKPHRDDFKQRALWSGSWRGKGRHKKALAGANPTAKCAWCERRRDVSRDLDVEHYRPKAEVTRWQGTPALVSDEPPKEVPVGSGYWWLAFSWENYSLACKGCNQGWKRNLFPVADPRPACVEGVELNERPLLLNPMTPFRTGDHFAWTVDAHMEAKSPEGEATIITCGLNRRELVPDRLKILASANSVLHEFHAGIHRRDVLATNRALAELGDLGDRTSVFAGMVRWVTEQTLGCRWEEFEGLPD